MIVSPPLVCVSHSEFPALLYFPPLEYSMHALIFLKVPCIEHLYEL